MRLEFGKSVVVVIISEGKNLTFNEDLMKGRGWNFLISSLIQESEIELLKIIFSEF